MLFQEQIIEKVKIKSKEDKRIAASMMYGSFTNGEGDRYSDVEFYIFLEEDEAESFVSRNWVSEIYPIELMFKNEYGTEVAIFENLIRAEFHFLPLSQINIIKGFKFVGYFPNSEAMHLYDSTDKLKSLLDYIGGTVVERNTEENISMVINNYINTWLLGINVLKRGELARSLDMLSEIQKYTAQLIRIKENSTEHWVNQAKQLEEEISSDSYEIYTSVTSVLEKSALEKAYKNALNFLEKCNDEQSNSEVYTEVINKLHVYSSKIQ